MVLPAPPPPDAPTEGSHGIIERLRLILRLAEGGVLVLVDDARLEQLGTFVRLLLPLEPNIEVHTSALGLLNVPDGSAVVLVPQIADATWLNQERPIFSQKRLRVLLYSDAETSRTLAHNAPDFFHWISHRMEAPKGAWPPAVFGLRAASAREASIAWLGADFNAVHMAAFPGQTYSIRSAAMTYDELVDVVQNEQEWLLLKDVDGPFRLRRVRWAVAESARRGMVALDQPGANSPEFWQLHDRVASLAEAIRELEAAGAKHPGRLAAAVHLEPETITIVAELIKNGIVETDIVEVALKSEDPGTTLARLAVEKNLIINDNAPPALRAAMGRAPESTLKLDNEHILTSARAVYEEGGAEVALRWVKRALNQGVDRIDALTALASISMTIGRFDEARQGLSEAIELESKRGNDLERRVLLLGLEGALLQHMGKLHEGRRTIEKALRLEKRIAGTARKLVHAELLTVLGRILEASGDLAGAEQAMRQAHQFYVNHQERNHELVPEVLMDLARVLYARNALDRAKDALEKSLAIYHAIYGDAHPRIAACFQELGRVYLAQEQFTKARKALEDAIQMRRKLGDERPTPDNANALHLLGRIHAHVGAYTDAINALEAAYQLNRQIFASDAHASIADNLHELGLVHAAIGNLLEARSYFERTLELERKIYKDPAHYQVAMTRSNLGMVLARLGERAQGLEMIEEAYQVLRSKLGPDHPATRDAEMKLARFS